MIPFLSNTAAPSPLACAGGGQWSLPRTMDGLLDIQMMRSRSKNSPTIVLTLLAVLVAGGCKSREAARPGRAAAESKDPAPGSGAQVIEIEGGFKGTRLDPDLPSDVVGQITFAVRDPAHADDGPSPYASITNPTPDIEFMDQPGEIVVQETRISIVVDYPMAHGWEFEITAPSAAGFTRGGLVAEISRLYHAIYAEEDRSARTKVVPIDQRKGLINRNRTDGTFGIWGHDIGDLVLGEIELRRGSNGKLYAVLSIDS